MQILLFNFLIYDVINFEKSIVKRMYYAVMYTLYLCTFLYASLLLEFLIEHGFMYTKKYWNISYNM